MILLDSEKLTCKSGAGALRWVQGRAFDLFKPVPALSPTEWADRYRILSKESSAQPGRYDSAMAPYQREPMDSVLDNSVERVVLMWASQTGKTETINNIVGFHIDWKPSPILVLQPTLEMAETWSKDRLVPMLRDTPRMHGKVQDPRSRDANNTILHKRFPGGHVTACGANSAASLASRPIRVVICDEVDRYPLSAGTEGDPVALAYKRSDTFADSVLFMTSTPTIKGISRIEAEFELTDKRHFFVPCPKCGKFQTLKWAQVQWPKDEPEKAYYECSQSACRARLNDAQRVRMLGKGEWRATAPFSGKRGYHLTGIYSPFPSKKGFRSRLHQMAVDFLDAKKKGEETLKVWTNTFLAETWEVQSEKGPQPELIYARREDYETIPEKCVVLVAGADVQQDRIEVEIVGSGAELQVAATCIDSGHKPKIVYSFVKRCQPRRVFAVKGVGTNGVPWVTRSKKLPVLLLKVNAAKEAVYSRLNLEEPGPGYLHFNKRFDLEFFRQLTSERVVTKFRFGHPYKTFEPHGRNEALDARVYAMAALDLIRPNYAKLAENLKAAVDLEKNPPQPEQKKAPAMRRGGFGSGWTL